MHNQQQIKLDGFINFEKHRFECEVRFIAKMPLQERRKYLTLVGEKRGLASRKELEAALLQMWKEKK